MSTCSVEGCERTSSCKGLCDAHYRRVRRDGETGAAEIGRLRVSCAHEDCEESARVRGLCRAHYAARKHSEPRADGATCTAKGCDRKLYARGLCATHYQQKRVRGSLIKKPIRKMGEGHITRMGYRLVRAEGHPNATIDGQIFEHRLVASQYLGRPLAEHETVHHRNGHRTTNTVGPCLQSTVCECSERHNLELWSTMQPKGQRVADKLAFAREILALYGDKNSDGREQ